MKARLPQDVDLEDHLIFGLTPVRFGYFAIAALLAFGVWSAPWAAPFVRASFSLPILGLGATLAWGRIRGRAMDSWVADMLVYVFSNHLLFRSRHGQWANRPAAPPEQR
jgi:hypothetical protein